MGKKTKDRQIHYTKDYDKFMLPTLLKGIDMREGILAAMHEYNLNGMKNLYPVFVVKGFKIVEDESVFLALRLLEKPIPYAFVPRERVCGTYHDELEDWVSISDFQ